MKFTATEEQAKQIFCNAINASSPMGLGILHYQPGDVEPKDIKLSSSGGMDADYFQGRMVKLIIRNLGDETWRIAHPADPPNPEYQSWAHTYPSLKDLVNSVLAK